ncbi:MAG: hypothetical protein QOE55_7314 [Acidobacteriaceae bacterium]|nr:hypothetical protein [Acidobacteriaceae bacterium]
MGRGVGGIIKGKLVLEAPGKYGNRQPQEEKGEPGQVRTDFVCDAHSLLSSYQSSFGFAGDENSIPRLGPAGELEIRAIQISGIAGFLKM